MIKWVTVLGKRNRVWWNSRKVSSEDWGDYDPDKHVIRIGKAPLLQQKEALLHELGHAIEKEYGFEVDHDKMTLLLRGVFAIMRDNPGLADLLFKNE